MLLLLIVSVLALSFYYYLRSGISINNLRIGNFKIEGLYLKLDNKLKLKAETLIVPKSSKQKVDIEKTIANIKRALRYFEYVDLENVKYTNDSYRVIISNDVIYIDNSKYEFAGVLSSSGGVAKVGVSVLKIKKYKLDLSGQIKYDYGSDNVAFDGIYKIFGSEGNASVRKIGNSIDFSINNSGLKSVMKIADMMDMSKKARLWLKRKTAAKLYKIISLKGKAKLKNGKFVLVQKGLVGEFLLQKARVRLKPTLEVLRAKRLQIRLHDSIMEFFAPDSVDYKNKHFKISKTLLINIFGKKSSKFMMSVAIKSRFDDDVKEFLSAFNISLPIYQSSGTCDAMIDLKIDSDKDQVSTKGEVRFSKGGITLSGVKLLTLGGKLSFDQKLVTLQSINLYDKNYNLNLQGVVDTTKKKAKLKADIKSFKIGSPKGVHLLVKNLYKLPMYIDFANSFTVNIPTHKLTIVSNTHHNMDISIKNLSKILPYVYALPIKISKGNLHIKKGGSDSYTFKGITTWKGSYLYQKDSITKIDFTGSLNKNVLSLNALGGKVKYSSYSSTIKIKDINIDLKKMLKGNKKSLSNKSTNLTIVGQNSIIRYDKYVLLSDNFKAKIKSGKISFVASKDGDKIEIEKSGDNLNIFADKIKDKMLKSLIHFGGLTGGRYSMLLTGNTKGTLKGIIKINGGIINRFKAYNNTIALLNTIPALMTLQDPGYSEKGFEIHTGQIKFRIVKDKVIVDDMLIVGKSSTIAGKGVANTKSGKLNMDLAIRTARGIGKIIGSLPLVGYILMDKDKSITVGVKITGTLDKPIVKSHPVLDTLLYPLKVIKRTLESPAHIINK